MIDDKKIYSMKLHEVISLKDGHLKIMRVPGGWIYYYHNSLSGVGFSKFVKYNNEFQ